MISLYQSSFTSSTAPVASAQQLTLAQKQSQQGNLIVVTGSMNFGTATVSLSDSIGNTYALSSVPFNNGQDIFWWSAHCICKFTQTLILTVNYSTSVQHPAITLMEYASTTGWTTPAAPDGFSNANNTTGTNINSGSLVTTTNDDDVVVALYSYTSPISSLGMGWNFVAQQNTSTSVAWTEVNPASSIGFSATQSQSGPSQAAIWAFQATVPPPTPPPNPVQVITVVTSVVNPTAFIEVYPNRVKEDIYDSMANSDGFVFVSTGPSLLN